MSLKCLQKLKDAVIERPISFEFGGVHFKFTAQIKVVEQTEIEKLTKKLDADVVRGLMVGWKGFVDDGKDVPFNSETLDEMLQYGGIAGRLSVEFVNAQYQVQEKN